MLGKRAESGIVSHFRSISTRQFDGALTNVSFVELPPRPALAGRKWVRRRRGIKGITNLIHIQQRVRPAEIKEKIEEAFRRTAELDAARITVEMDGGAVNLRAERQETERAAWAAPGSPGWITGSQ
jgi:osmotically-inducible protein OsmY